MPAATFPADFLSLLRCPLSGQSLAVADAGLVARARQRRAAPNPSNETLPTGATSSMAEDFAEALVRADGTVLYPIRDGIPVLLSDEAITL